MEKLTSISWRADRKLWLTADEDAVVEDGDARAAFLLAAEGDELSDEAVERYGLVGEKQAEAPANKARSQRSAK